MTSFIFNSGPNSYNESETIAKYEIMDGAPVRGNFSRSQTKKQLKHPGNWLSYKKCFSGWKLPNLSFYQMIKMEQKDWD